MKLHFSVILLLVANALRAQTPLPSKSFILGSIEEIQSVELSEKRILNIYTPEGYQPKDTIAYPVIYLLDGSADEDFIHIVGLVQYFNFPWINTIPKSIVVGIANVNRKRDFTFPTKTESDRQIIPVSGGSQKFIAFIEKEVQPFVEKKYKTSDSKTIIGQSLGGLVATEILFTKPALFNTYIIMSPSLWWDNGSMIKVSPAVTGADFKQKTSIYVGVGKEGAAPGPGNHIMEAEAKQLADKLKMAKNKNLKVIYDYLPMEDHATVTHPAVFNAFRLLNPKK